MKTLEELRADKAGFEKTAAGQQKELDDFLTSQPEGASRSRFINEQVAARQTALAETKRQIADVDEEIRKAEAPDAQPATYAEGKLAENRQKTTTHTKPKL
jgi:hypothetical protein